MASHPKHKEISVILDDSTFSEEEKAIIAKFYDEVDSRVSQSGVHGEISVFDVADSVGLDLSSLHKEGPVMYALWVVLLSVLRRHYNPEDYKYPTMQDFLQVYEGCFPSEPEDEMQKLWQTANWMNILFTLITARKNKGLAMQVVPKLVEGWHAKYVTGSGQTRRTAHRVHIFETEGNTKANHRGKIKPKKKPFPKRAARRRMTSSGEMISTFEPPRKRRRTYYQDRRANSPQVVDGHTDADDDSSVNEDVQEAFNMWSTALPLNESELFRSSSVYDFVSDLTPPGMQRGASWTEIPISFTSEGGSAESAGPLSYRRGLTGGLQAFSPVAVTYSENMDPTIATPRNIMPDFHLSYTNNDGVIEPKVVRDVFSGFAVPGAY